MKSKLIKELLAAITSVKETQSDVILDLNDDNKESVYDELLIPLMNLTNSDTVKQLHDKLEFLINGDVDSENHVTLSESLVNYVLDDESDNNFSDEVHNLVVNCIAVLNKFNELTSDTDDKKEDALSSIDNDLVDLINVKTDTEEDEESTSEEDEESTSEKDEEDVTDTKADNKSDEEDTSKKSVNSESTESPDENQSEEEDIEPDDVDQSEEEDIEPDDKTEEPTGMLLEIIPTSEQVDETPQGEVNKVELKNVAMGAMDQNEENKQAIDEIFALVKSYDKMGDQQQPHHVIKDGKVILNTNGLKTAALFLIKPNSSKNLTTAERTSIAKHLLKHYDELDMEKPDKLNKLASGNESTIIINMKDDEMREFGEMFKVSAEDVGTYIGLIEALLTDFVNSGIIDIESDADNFDESVITLNLDKPQTEEFIKYFDLMSDDIVNILSNELGALSYKQTDSDLVNKYQESSNEVTELKSKVVELNSEIEQHKAELKKIISNSVDNELTQTKFQAIIDFIKTNEGIDETIIQFINNVIEAESKRDISYMAKIGKSFMRSSANSSKTRFVKKSQILKSVGNADVSDLLDMVEGNNESATPKSVNSRVDLLSSYLD